MRNMHPVSFALKSMLLSIAGAALAFTSSAWAGGLQVSPISLQIPVNRQADGIWLINSGTESMTAQVRVFQWTQANNEDLLAPSTGLTISPPLIEIPPGARQLVRVIRTGPAPAAGLETTFRLIIDELPTEPMVNPEVANDKGKPTSSYGMHFLMRYSVPVFIGDATETTIVGVGSQLAWSMEKTPDKWTVRVTNNGSVRAQLADLQVISQDGQALPVASGLLGYVLAGNTMQWKVAAPQLNSPVKGYQAMINSDVQRINVSGTP